MLRLLLLVRIGIAFPYLPFRIPSHDILSYLLVRFNDIIVTGLAVLLALYALSQLIRGMWQAEVNKAK